LPNSSHNSGKIASKFRELRSRREGALIAYLTGGDPDPESFLCNAQALIEGGTDILEVGIPFSDPIADGPVIQASSHRALARGITPSKILGLTAKLSKFNDIPIVILTYYNPVMAAGLDKFMKTAEESGVNGVVVPDLSVEESGPLCQAGQKQDIDTIFLASPNTSPQRMKRILERSQGFLYLVSLFGVTGPRRELSPLALDAVKVVRNLAKGTIPIAAGFGITRPEHVSALLQSGADGAIVGSALVEIVSQNLDQPQAAAAKLRDAVSELKRATLPKAA